MSDQDDKRTPEEKHGAVTTILGETLARTLSLTKEVEGKQFSLFAPGDALPDDAAPATTEKGRGRPPGARNKATEELRAFVRARYGDPGIKLLERVFTDPKALAQALGAPSAWDVFKQQGDWMVRLMPFFWSAMPAELKVQAKGYLAVGIATAPNSLQAGDQVVELDPFGALLKLAQNQGLSEEGAGQSNDTLSNALPVSVDGSEG